MRILICAVGLPQSGKSTWAKSKGLPIVSPDAIRLALHGQPFLPAAEPLVWAAAHLMVQSLFHAGHPQIIVDATNCTRQRRNEWRSEHWETYFQVFNASVQTCLERAYHNDRQDLIPVINRMHQSAEPLGADESECHC